MDNIVHEVWREHVTPSLENSSFLFMPQCCIVACVLDGSTKFRILLWEYTRIRHERRGNRLMNYYTVKPMFDRHRARGDRAPFGN